MFQITFCDVNQTSEIVSIKKINILNFAATSALCIFIKSLQEDFKLWNLEVEGKWGQVINKTINSDNHYLNIWNKGIISSNTGQEQKTLITIFV